MELVVPQLAVGSHFPSEGVGCVMNLMSWEQGRYQGGVDNWSERRYDRPLRYNDGVMNYLIWLNDAMCSGDPKALFDRKLCTTCSIALINLAHLMDGSDVLIEKMAKNEVVHLDNLFGHARALITFGSQAGRHNPEPVFDPIKKFYSQMREKYHAPTQPSMESAINAYKEMTKPRLIAA